MNAVRRCGKVIRGMIVHINDLAARIGEEIGRERVARGHAGADQSVRGRHRRPPVDSRRRRPRRGRITLQTTIAHGFLTLSLVSSLLKNASTVEGLRLAINYGCDRVRFVSPVPSGSRMRGRFAVDVGRKQGRRLAGDLGRDRRARRTRKALRRAVVAGAILPGVDDTFPTIVPDEFVPDVRFSFTIVSPRSVQRSFAARPPVLPGASL